MIAFVLNILCARFERYIHQCFFIGLLRIDNELPDVIKLKRYRADAGEIPAVLAHRATHFRGRSILIISGNLDNQSDTTRRIALVNDLFVDDARQFAGTFFDRTLDIIIRHIRLLRLRHYGAQARIHRRITATSASSERDIFTNHAENLTALSVCSTLCAFDGSPFAVS